MEGDHVEHIDLVLRVIGQSLTFAAGSVLNIVWGYLISGLGVLPNDCLRTDSVSRRPLSHSSHQTSSSQRLTGFLFAV